MAADSIRAKPVWHAQEVHDAHALAIGRIVIAWNEFQEALGELFASIFGRKLWKESLFAWQALENDRAQREMLRAAAHTRFGPTSDVFKKISWAIEQANRQLSNQRNFGVHTPLMIFTDHDGETGIYPNQMLGNRKAAGLAGKDLLCEFDRYEKRIRKMTTFVLAIGIHVLDPSEHPTLPEKPQLQSHPPSLSRKTQHRQESPK